MVLLINWLPLQKAQFHFEQHYFVGKGKTLLDTLFVCLYAITNLYFGNMLYHRRPNLESYYIIT